MKKRVKKAAFALSVALPLVFIAVFLGCFPVRFDIALHTDGIVGAGTCRTCTCPKSVFSRFYQVSFYLDNETKQAVIPDFHYDCGTLELVTSGVSKYEITGLDSSIRGIPLSHFDAADIAADGAVASAENAALSARDGALHVSVDDPEADATLLLTLPFIPAWFRGVYFAALLLIAVLLALPLALAFDRFPALKRPAMRAACVAVTLLAGCFFCGSLPCAQFGHFLLNWALLLALSLLLDALTLPFLGTVLTMAFTAFWYVANYFVIRLRGKPVMPGDLGAIGTAREVMGGYSFLPGWRMVLGIAAVVAYAVMLVLVWRRNRPKEKRPLKRRLICRGAMVLAAAALCLLSVTSGTFKSLESSAWDSMQLKNFHLEGMAATFIVSALDSTVKPPEGYSRERVDGYLEAYRQEAPSADGVRPTNIIMVMNESFSDLRTVGLDPRIDVMPFIDGLDANTIEGTCYASVFGGGTCNTEFEALTGNTLAFLGPGAYPYTDSVKRSLFSLASCLKAQGWRTDAFHANDARNWNRDGVYPNLGFEAFHGIDDFEAFGEVPQLHGHPADTGDYHYMEAVDDARGGQPRFLFDVTMQNHSGYAQWLDVAQAASVAEYGPDLCVDTRVYLSLIKASDDGIRGLVEHYQAVDEPTMIVFFGDHQPCLPAEAINEVYSDVANNLDRYGSRFFIWTNYEMETQHDVRVSANYLPLLILERANLPLPPFVQMLKELHGKYPILSAQGVVDSDANVYDGVNALADDPLIQKYRCVQYANLFDRIDPGWFETIGA